MIIRAIRLRAVTERGEFGFAFSFAKNLTIIRASNSSGKSTLYNSLLYALGMEEIVGGKGERALPYAVKEHFDFDGTKVNVVASEVFVELESAIGQIITVRRAIRDAVRDSKLIDVFSSAHLTQGQELGSPTPTYVHDAGGAKKQEGFHHFLESFMGLRLPQVATTSGGESKLYLQTVFAALAVEQKRGWTDYIANIPFYGIRDARTRVVEFMLGLSVFETNATRNRLNTEAVEINAEWMQMVGELRREAAARGVGIEGVPAQPSALFVSDAVTMKRPNGNGSLLVTEYIAQLRVEHNVLRERSEQVNRVSGTIAIRELDATTAELQELSVLYERATVSLGMQRSSLRSTKLF